ncbi:MAG: hypothetical protein QF553_02390 [Alphaproteobacteria bacterium]|nr:hypothetical protein [Alphaproteobacteria bacterium]
MTGVGQEIACQCGQAKKIVELVAGGQTDFGGDLGAVELKLQLAVETEP